MRGGERKTHTRQWVFCIKPFNHVALAFVFCSGAVAQSRTCSGQSSSCSSRSHIEVESLLPLS
jgi:hypothetical protein